MKNKRGHTIRQRIREDIKHSEMIKNRHKRAFYLAKILGAIDLAAEFNLISPNEWEKYFDKIDEIDKCV